jgi:hypothetical protein
MPRAGQVRTASVGRLTDRIGVGLLVRTYPPQLVDRVIADCGRTEQRSRLLPARTVLYFVLAMCLFSTESYRDVARLLAHGLEWADHAPGAHWMPTTAAISRARAKLGSEPLKALFAAIGRPRAPGVQGGLRHGHLHWRAHALDAVVFGVPDSPENRAHFGAVAAGGPAQSAYPQVRLLTLANWGTGATRVVFGPRAVATSALAEGLLAGLASSDLVLLCDCLTSRDLWPTVCGADRGLIWRAPSQACLPVLATLADGSRLTEIPAAGQAAGARGVRVRLITGAAWEAGDLLTTALDTTASPVGALAELHREHAAFGPCLRALYGQAAEAPGIVLRSRSPEGVEQELWAYLLIHHAVRSVLSSTEPSTPSRRATGLA